MKNFYQFFIDELKDIYDAENQIVPALREMIEAVSCSKLKEAFESHLKETHNQIERLNKIAKHLKTDISGTKCDAMHGLLKEGHKVLKSTFEPHVKDAAIIGIAQRVEHYEIAVYGSLRTYAEHLKLDEAVALLNETLKEEGNANKRLTKIAEGSLFFDGVNKIACNE